MKLSIAKKALLFVIRAQLKHDLKDIPVPALVGDTGIGKTSLVKEVYNELVNCGDLAGASKVSLVIKHLSQVEVGDLVGMPHVENNTTVWAKPCWWPEQAHNGLLFLDEFGDVRNEVQRAAQQLLLERKIYTHSLPPKFPIVVAMNPVDPEFGGYEMSRQMKNRLMFWKIEPDVEDWLNYASKDKNLLSGIKEIVASDPDMLHETVAFVVDTGFRNPRSISAASTLARLMTKEEVDLFGFQVLSSICGSLMASMMIQSLKGQLDKDSLPISAEEILGSNDVEVHCKKLREWIKDGRYELVSETMSILKSYLVSEHGDSNKSFAFPSTDKNDTLLKYSDNVAKICESIPRDILLSFMLEINAKLPSKFVYSIGAKSKQVMSSLKSILKK